MTLKTSSMNVGLLLKPFDTSWKANPIQTNNLILLAYQTIIQILSIIPQTLKTI